MNKKESIKELSELRKKLKISQKNIAKQCGVSKSAIGYYENGMRDVPTSVLTSYSDYIHQCAEGKIAYPKNENVGKVFFATKYDNRTDVLYDKDQALRRMRENLQITLKEAGSYIGVSYNTLSNKERGLLPFFESEYETLLSVYKNMEKDLMNEIQVFDYKNKQIRTVEKDGEIWFVAKDVCEVLELTDVNMSVSRLDEDEKLIQKLFVSGQNRDVITISEAGLYGLILRSNKPEAKLFSRWVKHEVLPQIRKTGVYGAKSLSVANEIMPIAERILSVAGISGNQLALALDKTAKHYTGVSVLELSGVQLTAPVQEQILNPTQIGEIMGGMKAQKINEVLAGMGFQHKIAGKWEPLEPGKPYAVMLDVGKKHSNGIPVRHLHWNSSVIKEIKNYVERTGTED